MSKLAMNDPLVYLFTQVMMRVMSMESRMMCQSRLIPALNTLAPPGDDWTPYGPLRDELDGTLGSEIATQAWINHARELYRDIVSLSQTDLAKSYPTVSSMLERARRMDYAFRARQVGYREPPESWCADCESEEEFCRCDNED